MAIARLFSFLSQKLYFSFFYAFVKTYDLNTILKLHIKYISSAAPLKGKWSTLKLWKILYVMYIQTVVERFCLQQDIQNNWSSTSFMHRVYGI